ncbi:hypothetical protein [Actinomyces bowdenii]|uniref:hypothetical protein n=1 Tax=Actinomyces bowdenii TaxID=131109 RepID=UPI00163B3937|nr:hypothetical protein [Actinomyces bowdenii]
MPESVPMPVPMPVPAAPAARTVPTVPAAESSGARAPGAPAAVRAAGGPPRWEAVRAVMRLDLLLAWRRRDTVALLVLCALAALGAAVPGARGWLGPLSPEWLVYVLLLAVSAMGVVLWLPSREARMRRLYGALPVTRLDVLAARYLLLAAGLVIAILGWPAVVLAAGGPSDDAVGRHLAFLTFFAAIAAAMPPLLAAHGGTTPLPVLAGWGLGVGCLAEMPAVFGVEMALSAMPRQMVLAGGVGLISVLSVGALGASWMICRRIYTRQDH